ncbi:ABC transporter permease subunit [Thermococcus sp.]
MLFSADSDFDTLKGTYTFRVLCNCSAPPEIIVYGASYGLLGTDSYGRDIWVGFVKGMVSTLYLALFTTFMIIALGLVLGLISGYFKNLLSSIVTFFLEVLTALPILPILVVLTWVMSRQGIGAHVEVNPVKFMLLVSILLVGKFAKTIRIMTIQEKSREHVTASISLGASGVHVIRKHILPVVLEHSVRYFTFLMPRIVALISIFGFFGLIPGVNLGLVCC